MCWLMALSPPACLPSPDRWNQCVPALLEDIIVQIDTTGARHDGSELFPFCSKYHPKTISVSLQTDYTKLFPQIHKTATTIDFTWDWLDLKCKINTVWSVVLMAAAVMDVHAWKCVNTSTFLTSFMMVKFVILWHKTSFIPFCYSWSDILSLSNFHLSNDFLRDFSFRVKHFGHLKKL